MTLIDFQWQHFSSWACGDRRFCLRP